MNDISESLALYLAEYGHTTDSIGIAHGKMGIAVTLFNYARYAENPLFEEEASKLIDEVYHNLTIHTPIDFSFGLCGIGWAIEYLAQHNYVEVDTDFVLESIDAAVIREIHEQRLVSTSLSQGVCGLGRYLHSRIWDKGIIKKTFQSAVLQEYLIYLIDWLDILLNESMEYAGDVLYLLNDFCKLNFYPSKVEELMQCCIKTEQGLNTLLNFKTEPICYMPLK